MIKKGVRLGSCGMRSSSAPRFASSCCQAPKGGKGKAKGSAGKAFVNRDSTHPVTVVKSQIDRITLCGPALDQVGEWPAATRDPCGRWENGFQVPERGQVAGSSFHLPRRIEVALATGGIRRLPCSGTFSTPDPPSPLPRVVARFGVLLVLV
jgi:hypothetical protein